MPTLADALRKAGIVRHRRVRLSSGRTADFYVDLKAAYGRPSLLARMARELAALVPASATCIASGGYGGIPLATAVALRLKLPLTLVRPKPKAHGTAQALEGHIPTREDRVVLVDDVYTTGGSLRAMEAALRPTGARVALRLVVVNRSGKHPRGVRALVDVKRLLV